MIRTAGTILILLAYVAVSATGVGIIECSHSDGQVLLEWATSPCCAPAECAKDCDPCESDDRPCSDDRETITTNDDTCIDQAFLLDNGTTPGAMTGLFCARDCTLALPAGPDALRTFETTPCGGFRALNCGPPRHPITTILKNVILLF